MERFGVMRYATVCSGVEAASLAWAPLGWTPVFFSEIEPFPCSLLAHRHPSVPNLGDMTKIKGLQYHGQIDLLAGGTPCQDVSIAGTRKGFAGERSVLALDFIRLAYETGARWVVWENVPGTLSSNEGRDFATFLSWLVGYDIGVPGKGWRGAGIARNLRSDRFGVAWRMLNAEYTRVPEFPFGIPQRRRRLWAVGYLGDWTRAAEVLFEPGCLPGDPKPRRITGKTTPGNPRQHAYRATEPGLLVVADSAGTLTSNNNRTVGGTSYTLVVETGQGFYTEATAAGTLTGNEGQHRRNLITESPDLSIFSCGNGQVDGAAHPMEEVASTLNCMHDQQMILIPGTHVLTQTKDPLCTVHGSQDPVTSVEVANTVQQNNGLETCICAGFSAGQGAAAGGIGYQEEVSPTLKGAASGSNQVPTMLFYENHMQDCRIKETDNVSPLISAKAGTGGGNLPLSLSIQGPLRCVRRLMPLETERLQGFPDYYTMVPYRKKPAEKCPDSPRYKACGNSWAVNCAAWVGQRIQEVADQHGYICVDPTKEEPITYGFVFDF